MDGLVCDGCQVGLLLDSDVRYILRVEGFAAYDPMEITRQDLERDIEGEMRDVLRQLEQQSASGADDDVHRSMSFDLCPRCWKRFVRDPLGVVRRGEDARSEDPDAPGPPSGEASADDTPSPREP